jgi:hypothetical protein
MFAGADVVNVPLFAAVQPAETASAGLVPMPNDAANMRQPKPMKPMVFDSFRFMIVPTRDFAHIQSFTFPDFWHHHL